MIRKHIATLFLGLFIAGIASAQAQELPVLLPQPNLDLRAPGVTVAIARQPNGGVIRADGGSLSRMRPDGTADPDWYAFAVAFDERMMTLAADANGDVYVGGRFNQVNHEDHAALAKLSASSGALISDWAPFSIYSFAYVGALATDGHGSLYVGGGELGLIGGVQSGAVAKLSTTTGLADPGWGVVLNDTAYVDAIALGPDGAVYIGGQFTTVNGQPRHNLARLSGSDGSLVSDWNASTDGYVKTLALDACGGLYVGGEFTTVDGSRRGNVARLDAASGALDGNWDGSTDDTVYTLAAGPDCSVFAGGLFRNAGGQSRNYLAKLTATNGNADGWNPDPNARVLALSPGASDAIDVGGAFDGIAGKPQLAFARLDVTNGAARPSADVYGSATVDVLAAAPDGGMFVAGNFRKANGLMRRNILKLHVDGSLDLAWNKFREGGYVASVAVADDGAVYIGGSFGGTEHIIKLSGTDGSRDTGWTASPDGEVDAVAVGRDGSVYIGGWFEHVNGTSNSYLARLSGANGNLHPAGAAQPNAPVNELVTDSVGRIVATGYFTQMDGQIRHGLARLLPTGQLDSSWRKVVGIDYFETPAGRKRIGADEALAISPDDDIYLADGYRVWKISGVSGLVVPEWSAPVTSQVNSVAVAGNGDVYIGTSYNLSRLSGDTGALDVDWTPGPGSGVYALAVTDSGTVYVGGAFSSIGVPPELRGGLAAFSTSPPDASVTVDARFSGNWFDPAQSGHGFLLEGLPDNRFYATWYVFSQGKPLFLQGVGVPQGDRLAIDMFSARSTAFPVGGAEPQVEPWGQLAFTFSDLNTGHVTWAPSAAGFTAGSMDLTRLTTPASPQSDRQGVGKACRSGIWYDPSHPGYGFNLEVDDNSDGSRVIQTFWYTYYPDGSPLWLFGVAPLTPQGADVDLYLADGPGAQFPDAFDPATLERVTWGQVHLRFEGDDLLDVDYNSALPGYGSGSLTDLHRLTVLDGLSCAVN